MELGAHVGERAGIGIQMNGSADSLLVRDMETIWFLVTSQTQPDQCRYNNLHSIRINYPLYYLFPSICKVLLDTVDGFVGLYNMQLIQPRKACKSQIQYVPKPQRDLK
jgi:hypothetical protein